MTKGLLAATEYRWEQQKEAGHRAKGGFMMVLRTLKTSHLAVEVPDASHLQRSDCHVRYRMEGLGEKGCHRATETFQKRQ